MRYSEIPCFQEWTWDRDLWPVTTEEWCHLWETQVQSLCSYSKYSTMCCDHFVPVTCTWWSGRSIGQSFQNTLCWWRGGTAWRGEDTKTTGELMKNENLGDLGTSASAQGHVLCHPLCRTLSEILYPSPMKKLCLLGLLEGLSTTWCTVVTTAHNWK